MSKRREKHGWCPKSSSATIAIHVKMLYFLYYSIYMIKDIFIKEP